MLQRTRTLRDGFIVAPSAHHAGATIAHRGVLTTDIVYDRTRICLPRFGGVRGGAAEQGRRLVGQLGLLSVEVRLRGLQPSVF